MAQEELSWKALVLQHVQDAAGCCAHAHENIAGVLGMLAARLDEAEAPRWRSWVPGAEAALTDASAELAAAESSMAAAILLALRGAAPSPAVPLRFVADVPDEHEALRAALVQLQDATHRAEDACDLVDVGRANLCTARLLLDRPRFLGMVALVNVKCGSAVTDLNFARQLEEESTSLVQQALQGVQQLYAESTSTDQGPLMILNS